ncbi:hypothetical protein TBLA_0A08270 [Henningerozyma blattae CBS 6284]|uniref:Septin-type G domain-containing protein n=1 Tax=Henningerozyma blattae (strain ATCC 34711 / CBS 6284 / DSM 70876 / NBRC 10599 / NRRL Y-10934 / UCD 77-7) TaxID=1071380 RepID=I2GWW4_HENB6|nr:hypothetical protein TBLA_0A08270 [Tetrapisispora blattae CBS 6284]CCH58616.1 hypothetical protein TBLA_0A08270 [Tetrapisispora blattae CBS 6284]
MTESSLKLKAEGEPGSYEAPGPCDTSTFVSSKVSHRETLSTENTEVELEDMLDINSKKTEDINLKLLFDLPPLNDWKTKKNVKETKTIDENYSIGIDMIPHQRELLTQNRGINFTMMVAGQVGIGKTTFVNTLFNSTVLEHNSANKNKAQSHTRTKSIMSYKTQLIFDKTVLNLNIIDTPGFGSKIDNSFSWVTLVDYIEDQTRRLVFQDEQPDRSLRQDNKIHCCLYFLEPTNKGVASLDIITMKALAPKVNLIPVIGKADCLDENELENYKETVKSILKRYNIQPCQFLNKNDKSFSELFDSIPFSVICSETMVRNNENVLVRARKYKWGTIEIENSKHSDFTKLRELLIGKHLVDFVTSAEIYFEKCRTELLTIRLQGASEALTLEDQDSILQQQEIDILKTLNYDNYDSNGLKNYACYQIFNKKYVQDVLIQQKQEFQFTKEEMRKKLSLVFELKNEKFKNWENSLEKKQSAFKKMVESEKRILYDLNNECEALQMQISSVQNNNNSSKEAIKQKV